MATSSREKVLKINHSQMVFSKLKVFAADGSKEQVLEGSSQAFTL
ncbi:hypothetical protein PF002_g4667 [Phytophthora fragariae]|uniref:Uncharacterized protein n=1 Tax=Phytophthora fragariae TaxID=53985 RepID=A0A6A4A6E5_9STRA|nr:hypothetical protein PF002_g4667 [Phytophthora fragariae]